MLKSNLPLTLPTRFDTDTINAAKGVLILFVILGHASNFWTPEPFLTFSIKYFHVACFLLFPFIYDIRKFDTSFIKNIFARYYVPFAVFLVGYSVLYFIYASPDIQNWGQAIIESLIFGNKPMLDAASGLRALWFMPALISIVIIKALFIGRFKIPLWVLLLISLCFHISVGAIPEPLKYYLPMGLTNALYLTFIGLLIRYLCIAKSIEYLQKNSHVFLFIFIASIFFSHYFDTLIKFPVIFLPDYFDLRSIIIHDIIIISAFMFLITSSFFKKLNFLKWCGRNSLTIYLTHLLFLAMSMTIAIKYFDVSNVDFLSAFIIFSIFVFCLGGGAICVIILNKLPIFKNTIMPPSWNEWTAIKPFKKKDKS